MWQYGLWLYLTVLPMALLRIVTYHVDAMQIAEFSPCILFKLVVSGDHANSGRQKMQLLNTSSINGPYLAKFIAILKVFVRKWLGNIKSIFKG